MKNEKNATKNTALENTPKSWLEKENKYLCHQLDHAVNGWFRVTSESDIKNFCADMGAEEAECMPRAVGEAVRSGNTALWYTGADDNEYVEALPKELSAENDALRTLLRKNGAWGSLDKYALALAKVTTAKYNWQFQNTVLTVDEGATEELINQGLWRGDEVRMRHTRDCREGQQTQRTTIWYADGTVKEWESNVHVDARYETIAKVLERLHGMTY